MLLSTFKHMCNTCWLKQLASHDDSHDYTNDDANKHNEINEQITHAEGYIVLGCCGIHVAWLRKQCTAQPDPAIH